ncbi:28024_t:CDS:2 [Gigaspora margarita]|uniref:28024_t:CDS:1 n=1 Tax=Gigaspora margarita TaxID=4874 RepID=A0ABN7W3E6_GIGMA|nr:28024_t:CDS:2 [Gigaspora margarita]
MMKQKNFKMNIIAWSQLKEQSNVLKLLQLFAEPVRVLDYDFSCEHDQKLVLSVYFMIQPDKTNNDICLEQLAIFYTEALKVDGCIKPIWVLLVDEGPNKNSRHLKNINSYFKYNPVKRAIATILGKLARITLPIDNFGKHLDSQEKVINSDLAKNNFYYASKALCKIAIDSFVDLELVEEQEKKEKETVNNLVPWF